MTRRLMKVSRITAMAMWRIQLKSLPWNSICWMALRTWGQGQGVPLHPRSQDPRPALQSCRSPSPLPLLQPHPYGFAGHQHPFPFPSSDPDAPLVPVTPSQSCSCGSACPHHPFLWPSLAPGTQHVLSPNPCRHHCLSFPSQSLVLKPAGVPVGPLTGKRTMGTVSVTAVSTATRTHRMSTSKGSTLLYVCSSSDSTRPGNTIGESLGEPRHHHPPGTGVPAQPLPEGSP